uniref:Polypyrimidine tract binding protein 3 n=1 Tax=Mus musculus TaxID=10090 RepID=G3UZG7_MOUSE
MDGEPKLHCRLSVQSSQETCPFLELLQMKAHCYLGRALCSG